MLRFGVTYQWGALFGSLTVAENIALPLEEYTTKTPEEIKKLNISEYTMPNVLQNGLVKLRILVDRGSMEIFINDGESVLTHSVITELDNKSITITGGDALIKSLEIHELKSSWDSK